MNIDNFSVAIKSLKEQKTHVRLSIKDVFDADVEILIFGEETVADLISVLERKYASYLKEHMKWAQEELDKVERSIQEAGWRENDE